MKTRIALALRPELYSLSQIVEFAKAVDEIGSISHIFVPDIPGGQESIEISAAALADTKNVKVGSGVIRLLEHDNQLLMRRIETIQRLSKNRFFLGVGSGRAFPKPGEVVRKMISQLDELRAGLERNHGKAAVPETFVAALKAGMARMALGHCDGLLLNFCSPEYARRLVSVAGLPSSPAPVFACYLKVFYSADPAASKKMLLAEFLKYDSLPNYHEMFVRDGVAEAILKSGQELESGKVEVPPELGRVSLANPEPNELKEYVNSFRGAGIELPCIYPYFVKGEGFEYKMSIIAGIARLL